MPLHLSLVRRLEDLSPAGEPIAWTGSSRLDASKSYMMLARQQMLPFDGNSTIGYRGFKEYFH